MTFCYRSFQKPKVEPTGDSPSEIQEANPSPEDVGSSVAFGPRRPTSNNQANRKMPMLNGKIKSMCTYINIYIDTQYIYI